MTFEISDDHTSVHTNFGRIGYLPPGEVLSQLLTEEDNFVDTTFLDSLFTFDIKNLKKQAACDSAKIDTKKIMAPKF